MRVTARNQLVGTVVSVTRDAVVAVVKIDVGGQYLSATVTAESVDQLGIMEGMQVTALFKASSVILGIE